MKTLNKQRILRLATAPLALVTGFTIASLQQDHREPPAQPSLSAVRESGTRVEQGTAQWLGRAEGGFQSRLSVTRIIGTEEGPLGRPNDLVVTDEYVVVLDRSPVHTDNQVLLFDRATGRLVTSAGPPGQGPDELASAQSVQVDLTDPGRVWVNDYKNGRMALYDLDRLSEGPVESVRMSGSPFQAYWTTNGLFTTGLFATEILRRFDLHGDELEMAAAVGPQALDNQPPAMAQHWNRSTMSVHPDGSKLAVSSVFLDRVRLYDASGEWTHEVSGPEGIEPDFDDRHWGYTFLAASADRVFALFSGVSTESVTIDTTDLHVFDWDGRLVSRIELAEPIMRHAVSPDGKTIWGVRRDPHPALLEFASFDSSPLGPGTR